MNKPKSTLPEHNSLMRIDRASDQDPVLGAKSNVAASELFIRKTFEASPKAGLELLFRLYFRPLCNHAVRFVYSRQAAQDIVADVFYILWDKQVYNHITSSFSAYLFIAVRNRCLKHIRKEFGKVAPDVVDTIERCSDLPTPYEIVQFNELNVLINKAVQALPPQCQKVFVLSRFEGKTHKEIAQVLDISIKTIETHMTKALHELKRTLSYATHV